MRLRLWTVSDPARVLVVRKHYHKLAHASNRSPRRLGSMDLTETCDVLSWRKRVLMQGVTSCLQQTRAPTSNQLGSNNHIRIGLVARICRSQSSKDDQFRQGRGSIPRFGNLSFAHSMDERRDWNVFCCARMYSASEKWCTSEGAMPVPRPKLYVQPGCSLVPASVARQWQVGLSVAFYVQ